MIYLGGGEVGAWWQMEGAEDGKNLPAADGFLNDSANEPRLVCCTQWTALK